MPQVQQYGPQILQGPLGANWGRILFKKRCPPPIRKVEVISGGRSLIIAQVGQQYFLDLCTIGMRFSNGPRAGMSIHKSSWAVNLRGPKDSLGPEPAGIDHIRTPLQKPRPRQNYPFFSQLTSLQNTMRIFALLPFLATAVSAIDWELWGDSGNDNCGTPSTRLDVKKEKDLCQEIPGDYKSYHFTDDGGIKIRLYEGEKCDGTAIGYDLKGCIRPGTLKKAKYFKVRWQLNDSDT